MNIITTKNTHNITQIKSLVSYEIYRAYDCDKIVKYIEFKSSKVVKPTKK